MSKIYWGATLKNPRFPDMWQPAIISVSLANGNFLCRWSIFTLQKGHNPNQIKYAVGVAEVTPAQQAAVDAATVDIFYLDSTQIKQAFSTLPAAYRNRINGFCKTINLTPPANNEILYDFWNRMSVATDNKTLTMLEAELDADIKAASARIIKPLVPGVMAVSAMQNLNRRTLLKAAGLVGLYSIFRPKLARAVAVFTDNFTVGSNTDLDGTYPNWAYTGEGFFLLYANAANDRVQAPGRSSAYITAGGIPTGDQKITADCYSEAGNAYAGLLTRVDTGTLNYYLALFDVQANTVDIYRYDSGGFPLLETQSRGVGYPTSCSFQAVGTGATVTLTAIGGGTSAVTYVDSSGSRLTSGPPGIRILENVGDVGWIDNVVVDDLTSPAVVVRQRSTIIQ